MQSYRQFTIVKCWRTYKYIIGEGLTAMIFLCGDANLQKWLGFGTMIINPFLTVLRFMLEHVYIIARGKHGRSTKLVDDSYQFILHGAAQ